MTVLVGGISELFQGDLDVGRRAVEQLAADRLGPDVLVEDLYYGAVAVAQRIEELAPQTLLLVGAVQRGDAPGTVRRRWIAAPRLSPEQTQAAVGEAVSGYVHLDLVIQVTAGLGRLPARTVAVEVEPADTRAGTELSAPARRGLATAVRTVRSELARLPLLELAEMIDQTTPGDRLADAPAADALRELLAELRLVEREGRFGRSFTLRDTLVEALTQSPSSAQMEHRDWALWWALVEELRRLETAEAMAG